MNIHEHSRQVFAHLEHLMRGEDPAIEAFYDTLKETNEPLSVELLTALAPGYWEGLTHRLGNGIVHAYAREEIRAIEEPLLAFTNAPAAGGKTAVTLALARQYGDIARLVRTFTTRNLRPDERENVRREMIPGFPIEADVTEQYMGVTKQDFRVLAEWGYFLEQIEQYKEGNGKNALYGIPRQDLLDAIENPKPFTFLIVNEQGQNEVEAAKLPVRTQRWFILPTEQTFRDLRDRIIFQRASEGAESVAKRVQDAVHDLYAAQNADIVIPNPFEASGVPRQAVENMYALMGALRPDAVPTKIR